MEGGTVKSKTGVIERMCVRAAHTGRDYTNGVTKMEEKRTAARVE